MNAILQTPTADTVKAACERFDRENELIEQTLSELFQQYPRNDDLRHVLLKVVAVNALYHTCIYALDTVARHIYAHGAEIDAALAAVAKPRPLTALGRKLPTFDTDDLT